MHLQDYLSLGYQAQELARILGIGRSTYYARLHNKAWNPELPDLDLDVITDFIEASLLGDGSLVASGTKAYYSHSSSNLRYLTWLRDSLIDLGLPCNPIGSFLWKKELSSLKTNKVIYGFKSRCSKFLHSLRCKWYKPLKKVPSDFKFTISNVTRLYNEDGCHVGVDQCIYWGVKDDESFQRLSAFCKYNLEFISNNTISGSAGRVIRVRGLEGLPGYEYKSLSHREKCLMILKILQSVKRSKTPNGFHHTIGGVSMIKGCATKRAKARRCVLNDGFVGNTPDIVIHTGLPKSTISTAISQAFKRGFYRLLCGWEFVPYH